MRARRDKLMPLVLAGVAYVVALLQRPGLTVAETKVDLHVSPVSFLADVLSAWTPSQSLGHVFAGQYGGYLWPMAPWFALGHLLGLAPWVVDRLWLGTLLALAAWGTVRLLDDLVGRPRGVAHAVAALLFAFNPYVVTYAGRTSITLLAYAALPWLLVCVHRGLREPRGWWWPAAFALVLTSIGGGVNVAVIAWLLLGPLVLIVYEVGWGGVRRRAVRGFAARLIPLAAVASLWWVTAVAVHAAFGLPFLAFTEQPGAIWGTTSIPETLRLMGYWTSYLGVGYGGAVRPFQADAVAYLASGFVITASLLVPALALLGFAWTRRARYGPFFLLLTLVAVVVMTVGFPEGTPLRKAATFTYNHVDALQFLRTTHKAGPLLALGLAGLGGLAAAAAWERVRALPGRAALVGAGVALLALSCWPFVRGVGVDRQLGFERVPAAWRAVAKEIDSGLPAGQRAMVLPGQLFGYYRWGGTYDPILPALTDRPVAVRFIVPFSDLRSYELQLATDNLVSQERALPGQLRPLLSRLGVGRVIVGSDDDRSRSGAVSAGDAALVLREQGLRGARPYGPLRTVAPAAGTLAPAQRLPQVRTYRLPTPGLVRVLARGAETTLDGSPQGLVDLAAFGGPPPDRAVRYAADLDAQQIRKAARAGGAVVVSDSARRRVFAAARPRGTWGWTLTKDDPISEDGTQLDPFAARGTDAQTVAQLSGVRWVRAPFSPSFAQFPERRPYAALDGDPGTAWLADRNLDDSRRRLEVRFDHPRDVPYVDLLPYSDRRGVTKAVTIAGRRFALRQGWNRLHLGLTGARGLEVVLSEVAQPPHGVRGAGGLRELRVPGLRVSETLRPPVLAETALRGQDLSRTPLSYLFSRTTGDDPSHPRTVVGERERGSLLDQQDGERGWSRRIAPPAARSWQAEAWASVAPETDDALLDRLVGARAGGARFSGSSRAEGAPAHRGSSAFDGDPRTSWIAGWVGPTTRAWLGWELPRPVTIRALRLEPPAEGVRRPSLVRLVADGVPGPVTRVARDGVARPAAPARGRAFRLEVLRARFPAGTPARERRRRAVGVAEVRFAGAPHAAVPRSGSLSVGCGDGPVLTAAGRKLRMRLAGTVAQFDAGRPLRARPCGGGVALPARAVDVRATATPWRLDLVRLTSPAPDTTPAAAPEAAGGGRVLSPGTDGRGSREGVRVAVHGPSWLVLGESYDRGWRATCDGRDLGAPVPMEGFANAWPVARGCHDVAFAFAPNRWLLGADAISLVACLALLVLLVVRRRRPAVVTVRAALPAEARVRRWEPRRALLAGAAAAAVLGFVFALRAGLVLGPLVALVLWRGIGARALALVGGALLVVVVPILYLALPLAPRGYRTNWAVDHLAAHWVAVLAVCALGAALWRTLAAALVTGTPPADR